MASQRETDTLNRILRLNWQQQSRQPRPSQQALFGEFLRRAGVWAIALNRADAHPIATDFPAHVVPDVRATPVNTTLMQQTLRTLGDTSVYERMLLTHALNWSAIADHDGVLRYALPDLYEPLLWFYERGGWLRKNDQENVWDVSGVQGPLDRAFTYIQNEVVPLDHAALDAIDQEHPEALED